MRKKLLCTVSAVAMLAGLIVVAAPPAQAAPPESTQNFLPDDTDVGSVVGTFLSDKQDGTDTLAHLTNVSTRETSEVRWFLCPEERFDHDTETPAPEVVEDNDDLDGCDAAGTDNSGVTPEEGPGGDEDPQTDEAYETFFNIPASIEGDTVDVVAAACTNSAAADFEDDDSPVGDERNCTSDVEDQVELDDGQTGVQGAQTSSGEITSFCAVSSTTSDPCELDDDEEEGVFEPDPEVDANFDDFPHGSNIPNDMFTIRATTSIDVTELDAFLAEPADADGDPALSYTGDSCDEIDSDSDSREWQCTLPGVANNAEQELGIFDDANQAGNGGNCSAAGVFCKLDSHYVVSQDRRVEDATVSFKREGASVDDLDISLTAGCDNPDTADGNRTNTVSHIVGCLFDQFDAPVGDQPTSFESDGVGEFDATVADDCDRIHDHDDDALIEHCHSDAAAADEEYDAELTSDEAGDQNITFCLDEENGGTNTDVPADHGCADETVTATLVKTWQGAPFNITLVFDDGDADPCAGLTNKNNRVGESDELVACVFDSNGDPVSTLEEDNGSIQWFIEQGADDFTDTRFSSPPPQETDSAGQARATIEAVDPGTDNVRVDLLDEQGTAFDFARVQKQVEPRPPRRRSTVSIRHRASPHRFVGSVNPNACDNNRLVRVRRLRPGRDPVIGTDRTNANGRYRVGHRRTNRRFRYYAQVVRNASCRADNSRLTPRVR